MPSPTLPGLILKAQSGFFTVHTDQGDFVCQLRGRLKQHRQHTDLAAVGDKVEITLQPEGKGMIETIAPRRSALSRTVAASASRPGARHAAERDVEQVIVANVDQVVLVFAAAAPAPHLRLLDRFLVVTENAGLPALICLNKTDLPAAPETQALREIYPPLGYRVIGTSAETGAGLDELRAALGARLSVFTGPSGVGKSSLLNALQPGLGLRAREISAGTLRGKHTTVHPELMLLDSGGYVADTPGLRTLALWDIEPEELDGYFVEIRPYVADCAFSNCTHTHEPDCAVRRAVEAGKIAVLRYKSYCRLRAGDF